MPALPEATRRGGGTERERRLRRSILQILGHGRSPEGGRRRRGASGGGGHRRGGGSSGRWSASDVPTASHDKGKALGTEDCGERWLAAAFTEKGAAAEQGGQRWGKGNSRRLNAAQDER
jgi:hypothetical protein